MTTPGPDTIPPSVPSGLTGVAASSSRINLSWNASTDNFAVSGYYVFRDGVQVAVANSNSYLDDNLTASTGYSYAVAAFDWPVIHPGCHSR